MILKFSKCLNDKNEYTFISYTIKDDIDNVTAEQFIDNNNKIYETNDNYYYYIKDIIDLGDSEKFKIKVKKGDIISITAIDNSYIVYPSKKSFAYAFNLEYNKVLSYKYEEVLLDNKPYVVKYVADKDDKITDGVVYTLAQLVAYISSLIKGYIYRLTLEKKENEDDEVISRVIMKYYSGKTTEISSKYELNIKKVFNNDGKWSTVTWTNISKSSRYLYDYYLLRMFAYMILTKSKTDRETNNDVLYSLHHDFDTLNDVYLFLEEHQDIVNDFFIETELLFNKPNSMYTVYAPHVNGVYMYYSYNDVKVYLYRNEDSRYFNEKSLKSTYVTTQYKHRIKGIKSNYNAINTFGICSYGN